MNPTPIFIVATTIDLSVKESQHHSAKLTVFVDFLIVLSVCLSIFLSIYLLKLSKNSLPLFVAWTIFDTASCNISSCFEMSDKLI